GTGRRQGQCQHRPRRPADQPRLNRYFLVNALRVVERAARRRQTCRKGTNRWAGSVNRAVEFPRTDASRLPGGPVEILKVSSRSNPNSVAGAMAGVVRQSGAVEVQVVGAGALNQAVK